MEINFGKNVTDEFIKEKLSWDSDYIIKTARRLSKLSNLKQKKCYLCGGTKSRKVNRFYGINYLRCEKCSHVYADKRLSEKALRKFYAEDVGYSTHGYANKKILKMREDLFLSKIQYIKKYAVGKNWLDVGSADGAAVAAIIKEGFNCTGIEISKNSRAFAKKYRNLDLYHKPLEIFVKESKKKWDVVSFFGVLEHLPDPLDALRISNQLLAKNGIIAIEVPNYDSISTCVQSLSNVTDRHLVPYGHIMVFTLESAKYCLQKTGFKPIAVWDFGMDTIELLKYMRRKDKKFANSKIYEILCKKVNEIQRIFDEATMGDCLLIMGKKVKSL